MTFISTDPRATLAPVTQAAVAEPGFHLFNDSSRVSRSNAGSSTWVVRAQNLVLEYVDLIAGDHLRASAEPDECVVFTPLDQAGIEVRWQDQVAVLQERGLVAVPPGDHTVVATRNTHVVRLFTTTDAARVRLTMNAEDYTQRHPRVAPLGLWPAPHGQESLRRYVTVDAGLDPKRFGNIYRTRAFMVNWLSTDTAPRDPEKLSPHSHDDFEQISLAVEGEYVHHIRTPWTPRQSTWRPDFHEHMGSPSVAIIPPPTIHTSQSVGKGRNALIDIFAGPRMDFSRKPGWVLNAADYPMPQD